MDAHNHTGLLVELWLIYSLSIHFTVFLSQQINGWACQNPLGFQGYPQPIQRKALNRMSSGLIIL